MQDTDQREAIETDPFYEPPPPMDPNMIGPDGAPMQPGQDPAQQGQAMGPPEQPQGDGVPDEQQPVMVAAKVYAQQVIGMQPDQREEFLMKMDEKMPQMAKLVRQMITQIETTTAVDMRPLPEKSAPLRENSPI